jgi:DNA repair exonuclease SbcCD ATPase subunit
MSNSFLSQSLKPTFDLSRRGYNPEQVNRHLGVLSAQVADMSRERDELVSQLEDAGKHLKELHLNPDGSPSAPTYAGLGARVEKILRLAEEEAVALKDEARLTAEKTRAAADSDGAVTRDKAEKAARERQQQAEREATAIRVASERDAAVKREESEGLVEAARAKAAASAAEFETNLARRRDQAEAGLATRLEAAETRLQEMTVRTEQLRSEAEKLKTHAERRSQQLLDTAQSQAADIVGDARTKTDRMRLEAERELAVLTQRRDNVNAQLHSVREMLATFTGGNAAKVASDTEPVIPAVDATPTTQPSAPTRNSNVKTTTAASGSKSGR